mmetsp:Transcript_32431/g.109296  ORF Transcript_32431/g.109296 Transcript_32431/m.109296 type:complete len:367 (-) Transcript_32431:209-1309(-)
MERLSVTRDVFSASDLATAVADSSRIRFQERSRSVMVPLPSSAWAMASPPVTKSGCTALRASPAPIKFSDRSSFDSVRCCPTAPTSAAHSVSSTSAAAKVNVRRTQHSQSKNARRSTDDSSTSLRERSSVTSDERAPVPPATADSTGAASPAGLMLAITAAVMVVTLAPALSASSSGGSAFPAASSANPTRANFLSSPGSAFPALLSPLSYALPASAWQSGAMATSVRRLSARRRASSDRDMVGSTFASARMTESPTPAPVKSKTWAPRLLRKSTGSGSVPSSWRRSKTCLANSSDVSGRSSSSAAKPLPGSAAPKPDPAEAADASDSSSSSCAFAGGSGLGAGARWAARGAAVSRVRAAFRTLSK